MENEDSKNNDFIFFVLIQKYYISCVPETFLVYYYIAYCILKMHVQMQLYRKKNVFLIFISFQPKSYYSRRKIKNLTNFITYVLCNVR